MWSRKHEQCRVCGTASRPHQGLGLCKRCWAADTLAKNAEHYRQYKHEWYVSNVASKSAAKRRYARLLNRYGKYAADAIASGVCCADCGTRRRVQVQHKDHFDLNVSKSESNNDPKNIEFLCISCHTRLHSREAKPGWSKKFDKCRLCGTVDRPHQALGYCGMCYQRKDSKPRYWARNIGHKCCKQCKTVSIPHKGRGLCRTCHEKARTMRRRKLRQRLAKV